MFVSKNIQRNFFSKRIALNGKVKDLGNADNIAEFISDFATDAEKLIKFAEEPELVDAWRVLKDAPEVIRLNERWLKFVKNIPPDYNWTIKVKSGTAKIFNSKGNFLADITEEGIFIPKGRQGRAGPTQVEILIELGNNAVQNVKPSEFKFMQSSISNFIGEVHEKYFVLKNAMLLKTGELSPAKFDPIKIWVNKSPDGAGVWTLDHRRLAAYRLAGIEDFPVQWASEYEVIAQSWKMTTKNMGENMKINMLFDKNTHKFVHKKAIVEKNIIDDKWQIKKMSNGDYKLFDGQGNELNIPNDIKKYIE